MVEGLEPGNARDLVEAKAALTRHGIVIVRAIETDLEPALMGAAKSSMASSPDKLRKMDDDDLDKFTEGLREAALGAVEDLRDLYVRLLAKLGTDRFDKLAKELEGVGELFKWHRIAKSVEPVNVKLGEKGFAPIALEGPEALSESFKLELEQRWPPAFQRFTGLVAAAVDSSRDEKAPKSKKSKTKG